MSPTSGPAPVVAGDRGRAANPLDGNGVLRFGANEAPEAGDVAGLF